MCAPALRHALASIFVSRSYLWNPRPGVGCRPLRLPTKGELPPKTRQAVTAIIEPWKKEHEAPAVVVVIRQNGVTGILPFGDAAPGRPATADSIFELASVTKVFTTTSLAFELRAKAMQLGDPVTKYLPELATPDGSIGQVTLQQLATHTSGLPRTPGGKMADGEWTPEKLLEWAAHWKSTEPPGRKRSMSNIGLEAQLAWRSPPRKIAAHRSLAAAVLHPLDAGSLRFSKCRRRIRPISSRSCSPAGETGGHLPPVGGCGGVGEAFEIERHDRRGPPFSSPTWASAPTVAARAGGGAAWRRRRYSPGVEDDDLRAVLAVAADARRSRSSTRTAASSGTATYIGFLPKPPRRRSRFRPSRQMPGRQPSAIGSCLKLVGKKHDADRRRGCRVSNQLHPCAARTLIITSRIAFKVCACSESLAFREHAAVPADVLDAARRARPSAGSRRTPTAIQLAIRVIGRASPCPSCRGQPAPWFSPSFCATWKSIVHPGRS